MKLYCWNLDCPLFNKPQEVNNHTPKIEKGVYLCKRCHSILATRRRRILKCNLIWDYVYAEEGKENDADGTIN